MPTNSLHRFMLFPVQRTELFNLYEKMIHLFWTPFEIDTTKDKACFDKLPTEVQDFIAHTLMFFASSDTLVMENISCNLAERIEWPEARQCFALQTQQEAIHTHTYCKLIESLIDQDKQHTFFTALENNPVIQQKCAFVLKYLQGSNTDVKTATLIVSQACFEGISFSSAFASIFWLKTLDDAKNMQGLYEANHFISRDEGVHLHIAAAIYKELPEEEKLTNEEIEAIIRDAVGVEHAFADNTMPLQQMGMSKDVIKRYVNTCANYVAQLFGLSPLFSDTEVPDFCRMIGLATKANFFEVRETSYQTGFEKKFSLDDDF